MILDRAMRTLKAASLWMIPATKIIEGW